MAGDDGCWPCDGDGAVGAEAVVPPGAEAGWQDEAGCEDVVVVVVVGGGCDGPVAVGEVVVAVDVGADGVAGAVDDVVADHVDAFPW